MKPRIATACPRCGKQLHTRAEAWLHCRRKRSKGPFPCRTCGKERATAREAYTCCQQTGLQRQAGFVWKNHETPQRAYERRVGEIRGDEQEMGWIRIFAEYLIELMPPAPDDDE